MVSSQSPDVTSAPDVPRPPDVVNTTEYRGAELRASAPRSTAAMDATPEDEWSAAVLEVERARQAYVERLRSAENDDPAIGRLWLRLWRAERKRDRLIRSQI